MVTFAPSDPAFLENPFPFYKMGLAMSPLFLPSPGMWLVFGYEDCLAILRDNRTWSSEFQRPENMLESPPPPSMLGSDPPRHARLRGLVSQAFTPRMVDALEPRIREIADELLSAKLPTGSMDLVHDLADPLPVIVISEILGIPAADREKFKLWSDRVVAQLGAGASGGDDELPPATFEEMRDYFSAMVDERRAHPKRDLISGLVRAEIDGQKLNFDELLQMLILLLVAGNETTTNLIGNAVLEFMAHPVQLARLRADMSLLPGAIEEVLRFNSPVQATVRSATRDVQFGEKTIERGQQAVIWLASANRDAAVFPEPETFDISRTPNRHLAFGQGIHFCLGAPLARLEAKVALEEFILRTSHFERTDSELLPRVPTFIMRGVRKLPLAVSTELSSGVKQKV
ncbi:MAG: cytochrome P450 [Anaerolineaceae bacterium]